MPAIVRILDGYLVLEAECIDRMYLNGCISGLQVPGELISFLVKQGKHPFPWPALPGKMTDRFAESAKRCAQERNVPIVHFGKGQRKNAIAAQYYTQSGQREGVVRIGVGRETVTAFKVGNRFPSSIFQPLFRYPLWTKSRYLLHPSPCSNLQPAIRLVSTDPPECSAIPSRGVFGKGRSRDRLSW